MNTNEVGLTAPTTATSVATTRKVRGLGDLEPEQFLNMLVTELQNQDPLDPMDSSEILATIGQIRAISATDKLTQTLDSVLLGQNLGTASGLIGKRVEALSDGGENVEGVVDRVTVVISDGENKTRSVRIHFNEHDVRLENIREIIENETEA